MLALYLAVGVLGFILGDQFRKRKLSTKKELKDSVLYNYSLEIGQKPLCMFFSKTNDIYLFPISPEDIEVSIKEMNGKPFLLEGSNMSLVFKKEDGLLLRQPVWVFVEYDVHPQTTQLIQNHKFFTVSGESMKKYDELITQQQFLLDKLKKVETKEEREKLLEKIKQIDEEINKIKVEEKDNTTFYLGELPEVTKKIATKKQGISLNEEVEDLLRSIGL